MWVVFFLPSDFAVETLKNSFTDVRLFQTLSYTWKNIRLRVLFFNKKEMAEQCGVETVLLKDNLSTKQGISVKKNFLLSPPDFILCFHSLFALAVGT